MRIIAGKFKNRNIPSVKNADYRPSTGKLREALFSILTSGDFLEYLTLEDARVLDLFAGTGALSFEALSRGAKSACLVDMNAEYLEVANRFAQELGIENNFSTLAMNATRLLHANQKYNLVFIDPPYYRDLVGKTIARLFEFNWLDDGAVILVEMGKDEEFKKHHKLELIKEKIYGKTKLLIFKYNQDEKE